MAVFSTSPVVLGVAMFGLIVVIFGVAFTVLLVGKARAKKANDFDLPDLDIKSVESHRKVRKGTAVSSEAGAVEEWAAETSQMSEQEEKMFRTLPGFTGEGGYGGLYDAPELAGADSVFLPYDGVDEGEGNRDGGSSHTEPPPARAAPPPPNPLIPPLSKRKNS